MEYLESSSDPDPSTDLESSSDPDSSTVLESSSGPDSSTDLDSSTDMESVSDLEIKEKRRLLRVLNEHRENALKKIALFERNLIHRHSKFEAHYAEVKRCINRNSEVLTTFAQGLDFQTLDLLYDINFEEIDSVLMQIAHDWGAEAESERKLCYEPIINAVEKYFPRKKSDVRILVSECGAGRLLYDLSCKGYDCAAQESSTPLLAAVDFILNKCNGNNKYIIHPWVHEDSKVPVNKLQTVAVRIPNINVETITETVPLYRGALSQVCLSEYDNNCTITFFNIRINKDFLHLLEAIRQTLDTGGIWINVGPPMSKLTLRRPHLPHVQNRRDRLERILENVREVGFTVEV